MRLIEKSFTRCLFEAVVENKSENNLRIDYDLIKYLMSEYEYYFKFPEYNEVVDEYSGALTKKEYNKAIEIVNKIKDIPTYNGALELSANHTLHDIRNLDDAHDSYSEDAYYTYCQFVEDAVRTFEEDTGVKLYGDGRSGRHIVVDDTIENRLRYDELKEKQGELEEWVIDTTNRYIDAINSGKDTSEAYDYAISATESMNESLKDTLIDDVAKDIAIEPGSAEEDALNSIYDRVIKGYKCKDCGTIINQITDFDKKAYPDRVEYYCPKCSEPYEPKDLQNIEILDESDEHYIAFSSGELDMSVPFNNDRIKREVIKGKGGRGPGGETDLVKYTGTKEDLEKLMDTDFDGEHKNRIKKLDEATDPDRTAKRIARYGEFDNGHVIHSWLEDITADEAEEMARQASIETPDDVHYVQYDDVMYDGSGITWLNGKKYTDGGFHYVNGKPVHHTDEEYDLVSKGEKTWEDIAKARMNESEDISNDLGMTLKEYAMKYCEGDIDMDVSDTEIDMIVAFVCNFNNTPEDNYDKFLNLLGERAKVVKDNEWCLVCDFSSIFKPYEDKLQDFFNMEYSEFNEAWAEAVLNLEGLIPGMSGEKTYGELLDILEGK